MANCTDLPNLFLKSYEAQIKILNDHLKIMKEIAKHGSCLSTSNCNTVGGNADSNHKKRKRTLETADSSRPKKFKISNVLNINENAGLLTNSDMATTDVDENEAVIQPFDPHYVPSSITSTSNSTTTHMKQKSIVEVRKSLKVPSVVANNQSLEFLTGSIVSKLARSAPSSSLILNSPMISEVITPSKGDHTASGFVPRVPSNSLIELTGNIDSWLEKVFSDYEPHPVYLFQDDPCVAGSLFSSHHNDMSSKLIGFDLPAGIQMIEKNLRIPRSAGRSKHIIGTVRGTGAGKTRILEEFRQHYLKTPEVLIISVTFNRKWDPTDDDLEFSEHMKICIALSVITRMASVFYNERLRDIFGKIQRNDLKFLASLDDELLIRRFVQFIVNKVRETRVVKSFILQIDEPMKLEKLFINHNISDCFAPVRGALLTEESGDFVNLSTALVLASLDPNPFGDTVSSRGITLLPPTKITGEMIVKNWWIGTGFVGEDLTKLVAFATLVSPIPRLVEFGFDFIKSELANFNGKPLKCNDSFFGRMLEMIDVGIIDRYRSVMIAIPSVEVLYNMTYGYPIEISIAKKLIHASILTNQFCSENDLLSDPIISVQMLHRSLQTFIVLPPVVSSLSNIIREILTIGKYNGHSLEVLFREWFVVRASLALKNPKKVMTIGTLLGFNDDCFKKTLKREALLWLMTKIEIPEIVSLDCVETVEESLYQNPTKSNTLNFNESSKAYYKILKSNFPTVTNPVVLIDCAEGDHQDSVLLTYSGDVNKPVIQGIDCKAREELSDTSIKDKSTLYFPGDNHVKWRKFCKINNLPYRFIYLTTHEGETYYRDGVLVIRRAVASKFFGSMWETYLAARTVDAYTASEASSEKDSEGGTIE